MTLNRLLPKFLNAVLSTQTALALAALFALLAVLSFFSLLGGLWSDLRYPSTSSDSSRTQRLPLNDLAQQIPEGHLLGYRLSDSSGLPLTHAELRLTGIAQLKAHHPSAFSKALISIEGGPSKVIDIGTELLSGIKLIAIEANQVILDNHGHHERLPLQRSRL